MFSIDYENKLFGTLCSPFLLDFLYLEQVLKVERNAFVSKIYIRNKIYKKVMVLRSPSGASDLLVWFGVRRCTLRDPPLHGDIVLG